MKKYNVKGVKMGSNRKQIGSNSTVNLVKNVAIPTIIAIAVLKKVFQKTLQKCSPGCLLFSLVIKHHLFTKKKTLLLDNETFISLLI